MKMHGDRHYTLDYLDENGQRFIVHSYDLMEAVYELGVLMSQRSSASENAQVYQNTV